MFRLLPVIYMTSCASKLLDRQPYELKLKFKWLEAGIRPGLKLSLRSCLNPLGRDETPGHECRLTAAGKHSRAMVLLQHLVDVWALEVFVHLNN